jgi:pimeloyl-ACP methyl ester carboxylesterase
MVRAGDLKMHYRNYGRPGGEPLVLLHNFTSTGHIFDPFLDQLGEKYRLIVPDCGHMVPSESPAIFLTALIDFLARNPF